MRSLLFIASMLVYATMTAQQTPQIPKSQTPTAQTPTSTSTSSTKTASCDWGDCQEGYGKKTYDNGDYIGFWTGGLKHGYGSYFWTATEGQYIGRWTNDKMDGYGVYLSEDNDNLRGQYRDGKMNGIGVTVRGDTWTQGIFTNGDLTTNYNYYDNNKTTGCTIGDCSNGYGRWEYTNGDSYIGFFKNSHLQQGSYNFSNGAKYSGEFNSSDQMHGMGRYWAKDGAYYGGEWVNGKFNGLGYYQKADGTKEVGQWTNGTLTRSMY